MVIYNIAIYLLKVSAHISALLNAKARAFVNGRAQLFLRLEEAFKEQTSAVAWFHCASLGEFEQARPLIERFKQELPAYKILLTFFSPSGFEIRKNYPHADFIFYLPWDTPANARRFIATTRPAIALFIKYEFWHNYIHELSVHGIPLLSVSAIFRNDQVFFKPYGKLLKSMLYQFDHFFVQNTESADLLKSIGISRVAVSGDTRFDRVWQILQENREIPLVERFKGDQKIFIIGSCWPEDFHLLAPFIYEQHKRLKFIIAPHEIDDSFLSHMENELNVKHVRYSKAAEDAAWADVLIIDSIGLLPKLYRYATYAYVGGALGKGLHNILEAACHGIPVFFGNKNYRKSREATDLILRGGAFEVGNYPELNKKFERFVTNPETYQLARDITKSYVTENLGATKMIMDYCHQSLSGITLP